MLTILKTAASLLLIALLNFTLAAQDAARQEPTKAKPPEPSAAEDEPGKKHLTPMQQRAFLLLDSLFDKAKEIDNGPFRIRAQAQIADALWAQDEERARQYFTEAFNAIEALKAADPQDIVAAHEIANSKLRLRQEMLRLMAPHDLKLVETLLKQIKEAAAKEAAADDQLERARRAGGQNEAQMQYLLLAETIAETDPARAAHMVRESLASGLSIWVINALLAIRQKNPALADQVFSETLMVAAKDPASLVAHLAELSAYPRSSGQDGSLSSDPARLAVMQQFLNFAYGALLQQAEAAEQDLATGDAAAQQSLIRDVVALQDLLPLFDQFLPDQANAIRVSLSKMSARLSDNQRGLLNQIQDEDQMADLSSILKSAESAHSLEERDRLYAQAAEQALRKGDLDQSLFIAKKINNRQERESTLSMIHYLAGLNALRKQDWEEAQRQAKEIDFLPQRVELFKQLAGIWLGKKNTAHVSELLNDLEKWVSKAETSPQRVAALVEIAELFARYDATRGFEVMQAAVKAINTTDFSPPKSDTVIRMARILLEDLNFRPSFSRLGRADFDRALLLAQSLEKKEAMIMTEIALCQGVLNDPSAPETKDKSKAAEDQEKPGKEATDKSQEKKPPIK